MRRLGCLLVLAAALAAPGSGAAPAGTSSPFVVGGIAPAGSPLAAGAAAYFRFVNGRGGVRGRTIEYRVVDGGKDPRRAARALVADGALALFGTVGTDALRAAAAVGAPQLFAWSGASMLGAGTLAFSPGWALQTGALARQTVTSGVPGRLAVLYEGTPDGLALLAAFRRALGARSASVVASTRLSDLRGAGPLVVLDPEGVVARAGRDGALSTAFVKDARDPRWAGDPAFEKYRRTGGLRSVELEAGMAAAYAFVAVLRRAGPNPTPARLLAAARSLVEADNPFLIPGIVVRGRVRQVALERWSAGRWSVFTGPVAIARYPAPNQKRVASS